MFVVRLVVDSDDPGERWEMSVETRFRVVIVWMDSWVEGAVTEAQYRWARMGRGTPVPEGHNPGMKK